MTVQEIYQSTLYGFGQDPSNRRFNDDFYSAINTAQSEFSNRRKWGFLRTTSSVTTTDGVRYVALPTDFKSFYNFEGAIRITSPTASSGNALTLIAMEEFYAKYYDDDEEGEPTYCWVMGANVYFSEIPDAAYVVAFPYYKKPTNIADTSSTITVPSEYHECLKKMIYRRLQDAGYSSVQELSISDNDVERLMRQCARDDIEKYGGLNFNLPDSAYTIRTV